MRGRGLAPAALAAATVAVSFSAIFIRIADSAPATVVALRLGITVALLAPWALRDAARGAAPRGARQWGVVAAAGILLGGHFLAWTASLQHTAVASAVLLMSLHPVIVAALGRRLLGEPVSARLAAAIGLALAGTAITTAGDQRTSAEALLGDGLAVVAGLTFAGYLLIGRRVRAGWGAAGYSASVYAVGAALSLAIAPASGASALPTVRTALACAALAVVCTIGGHTVVNWTLRHLRAAVVSLAFLAQPPITAALALLLLAQAPGAPAAVGGVAILAALAIALTEPAARAPIEQEQVAEMAAAD